jgi:hypothetical protein
VAATRHVDAALDGLPSWWGIIAVEDDPQLTRLVTRRNAARSAAVEVDVIVRLLWREEVAAAIRMHGHEPALRRGRSGLWAQLLACGTDASTDAQVVGCSDRPPHVLGARIDLLLGAGFDDLVAPRVVASGE